MLALQIYGLLVLGSFLIVGWKASQHWTRTYRRHGDPYPPEAAEAPTGECALCPDPIAEQFEEVGDTFGFTAPACPCCRDGHLDALVAGFNWARYETWLKEPS